MIVIGIDPGPEKSGLVGWDGYVPLFPEYYENMDLCSCLTSLHIDYEEAILAVERPVCQRYSGVSVSDTAIEAGRFLGVWGPDRWHLLTRSKIRWHIGRERKTNDSLVRKSLIDRIYPGYNFHRDPGPLIGITGDIWQALAVAVTCFDLLKKGEI